MNHDQRRELMKIARESGYWEEILEDLQQGVLQDLVQAKNPEEAYIVAIRANEIPRIMSILADKLSQ